MELPSPILFILTAATPTVLSHTTKTEKMSILLHNLVNPSFAHLKQLPPANLILAALYVVHYSQRAVIQSIRSPPRSPSHISVVISSIIFNIANGFTMGSWIGGRSPSLLVPASLLSGKAAVKSVKSASWFAAILPRSNNAPPGATSVVPVAHAGLLPSSFDAVLHPLFLLGLALWAVGFVSNVYHDEILFDLRRPEKRKGASAQNQVSNSNGKSEQDEDTSKPRYEIPHGGLYRWISYPNYFSEWIEWTGYALAALSQTTLSPLSSSALPLTWSGRIALLLSAPPLVFLLVEIAVMLPRAVKGHQWYHAKFGIQGDGQNGRYPKERKAVIPFLL